MTDAKANSASFGKAQEAKADNTDELSTRTTKEDKIHDAQKKLSALEEQKQDVIDQTRDRVGSDAVDGKLSEAGK